jgi:hypothetical protein
MLIRAGRNPYSNESKPPSNGVHARVASRLRTRLDKLSKYLATNLPYSFGIHHLIPRLKLRTAERSRKENGQYNTVYIDEERSSGMDYIEEKPLVVLFSHCQGVEPDSVKEDSGEQSDERAVTRHGYVSNSSK